MAHGLVPRFAPVATWCAVAAACVLLGGTASAQSLTAADLQVPRTIAGSTVATTDARLTYGGDCWGSIGGQPAATLQLGPSDTALRFDVDASVDTTLIVTGPVGTRCNDDFVTGQPAPRVSGTFPAGTYQVYVGLYQGGEASWTLTITPEATGGTVAAAPDDGGGKPPEGTGGAAGGPAVPAIPTTPPPIVAPPPPPPPPAGPAAIALRSGMVPDPVTLGGELGGSVNATSYGRTPEGPCRGMIPEAPQHIVQVESALAYGRIAVRASVDTTLVIRHPSGRWMCDDDTNGTNPVVDGRLDAGRYEVWVGTLRDPGAYTLSVGTAR